MLFLDTFSSPQINQMPLPLTPTAFNACFNHYPNLSHLTGLPVHTDHFGCPERPGSLWHWEQQLGDFGHCWSLAISWCHYRTTDWTESSAQWTGWWKKLAVWRRLSWSSAVRVQQQPGGDRTRQWWHQTERGRGHSWPAALLLTWKVDKNLMIKKIYRWSKNQLLFINLQGKSQPPHILKGQNTSWVGSIQQSPFPTRLLWNNKL